MLVLAADKLDPELLCGIRSAEPAASAEVADTGYQRQDRVEQLPIVAGELDVPCGECSQAGDTSALEEHLGLMSCSRQFSCCMEGVKTTIAWRAVIVRLAFGY